MYSLARLLLFNIISLLIFGCSGYTWISGTHYYPSDSDHRSLQYRLRIEVQGQKRHAYADKTKKRVLLTILKDQTEIFNRDYECTAASLTWNVTWEKIEDLNILFFDFAEGVSIYNKNAVVLPAKQIFTLKFTYDSQSKEFIEYPVSSDIVRRVKPKAKKVIQ